MSKKSQGKIWPYAIVGSILLVIGASVITVVVALENPVQLSDHNLQDYHSYMKDANQFIDARIRFDKKYKISYVSERLDQKETKIAYKVTDHDGNAITDAKIDIMITRPDDHDTDIPLHDPIMDGGVYSFEGISLPKPGRWNLIAHVVIGDHERYYNLKADTRYPNTFEY